MKEPIPTTRQIYALYKVIRMCDGRSAVNIEIFSQLRLLRRWLKYECVQGVRQTTMESFLEK